MLVSAWNRCCVVMFLVAALRTGASQVSETRPKANSIKPGLVDEAPTPATNQSSTVHIGITKKHHILTQVYPCSSDKECTVGSYCHSPQQAPSRCLTCRRRKKRCHRDAMCCPGNRCSNYICVPISESVLSPHISALDEHYKLSTKDHNWKKSSKAHAKHSLKGKIRLCIPDVMFKTCPPESSHCHCCLFSHRSFSPNLVWVAESFCCSQSYRVHGRRQSTNYFDNYLSAHMSVSLNPKRSMSSPEETTMPLLFLHLHKAVQTLSLTAPIVWYTSENHRMQIWHDYS
nr:PREDICTED: dickkopf-related protein 2 isoform X2 [Paralichthys olivaceus]